MVKMHSDQLEVGVADVQRLVRDQMPQFAELPIRPVMSTGTMNAVFRLGDELLARLPLVAWGSADIEHEARWLPVLGPFLAVPAPRLIALGTPDERYPCTWSILTWMPGTPAGIRAPVSALGSDLAAFITTMRGIDVADAPACYRAGPLAPLDGDVQRCLDEAALIVDAPHLRGVWADCLDAPPWTGDPAWAHGDLLPGNVLVEGDRVSAVIDFACAGVGDPACDLMAAWSMLPDEQVPEFRDAVGIDDATWARGLGWSLAQAIIALPYYVDTNPVMATNSRRILERIAAVR